MQPWLLRIHHVNGAISYPMYNHHSSIFTTIAFSYWILSVNLLVKNKARAVSSWWRWHAAMCLGNLNLTQILLPKAGECQVIRSTSLRGSPECGDQGQRLTVDCDHHPCWAPVTALQAWSSHHGPVRAEANTENQKTDPSRYRMHFSSQVLSLPAVISLVPQAASRCFPCS